MNFLDFKNLHLKYIERYIEKIFDEKKNTQFEEIEELIEEIKCFTLRPGKRIRPLLFLLGYEAYKKDETISKEDLYYIAATIEIMHSFLLIHDDIMDRATIRRGAPALHVLLKEKYKDLVNNDRVGEDLAVVLGDLMAFFVLETLSKLQIPNFRYFLSVFSKCYINTAYGQILDTLYSLRKGKIRKNVSFEISKLKTSYYTFYFPFYLGYILTDFSNSEEEEIIREAIVPAGIAFQIRDDIISTFDKNSGKPNTTDLLEGKFTTLIELGDFDESFFKVLSKKEKNESDLDFLLRSIKSRGSIEKARNLMNAYFEESLTNLERLSISNQYKRVLKGLIEELRKI
ncbi:MAG: polyprenyl synthetase family protein [Thermosipho sp. (in: Bacteria)]|nr:polyprenyl synthetase family protein [Thermosipho sp. (in: thermotogales)]